MYKNLQEFIFEAFNDAKNGDEFYTRIEDIEKSIENQMPIDMIELDIKNIWEELGKINGSSYEEELLDEMFKRFCLGK